MSVKKEVGEVTFPLVATRCKSSLTNPATGKMVDKARVYTVFWESCYDEGAHDTWGNLHRGSKDQLTDPQIAKRYAYGLHMQSLKHTAVYYRNKIVWTDICNKIIPLTEKKASEQALARKGKRGWISTKSRSANRNLAGSKSTESNDKFD